MNAWSRRSLARSFSSARFALGNVGGLAENILRLTRRIAQKGEFHARPNQASIPQEVALVDVEVIDLAGDQFLERIPVLLQVIRMGEPVKHAGKTEFLCRAAKHATVSGVNGDATIFQFGDRNPEFSALKDASEFLLAFTNGQFKGSALGSIQKCDDRADGFASSENRMGPVFDRKAGAIAAPEDFVIGMGVFAGPKRINNGALSYRNGVPSACE